MRFIPLLLMFLTLSSALPAQGQDAPKRRRPDFRFDPTNPDVHDPVMAWEGDSCYVLSTGVGINVMASTDMVTWHPSRPVFGRAPQWAVDSVPGYRGHTWAPDILRVGQEWHVYYSCSTFGRNRSAIGLATGRSLSPASPDYGWTDQGMVLRSRPRQDDWNAIDPNVLIDERGRAWLTFGSFWDGIQQVRLSDDLRTPVGKVRTVARRRNPYAFNHRSVEANSNAVEAPFLIRHDGYYYLFVSFDLCCKGLQSNYKTAVGRSKKPNGPFRDRDGKKMLLGGGTILVGETERYAGVGHCGVYEHEGQWWFVAHGYDKTQRGQSKLVLRRMHFDQDGWPVLEEE